MTSRAKICALMIGLISPFTQFAWGQQSAPRSRCERRLHNSPGDFRNSERVADVNNMIAPQQIGKAAIQFKEK